ncbi:tyrosine-type recombinase/integrase [Vibrio genomosp. F10]|uniref:tyrosine-type recombinase/integrase n=1 Tax=Vibrio genomosp. F10 TaxID=723171 RepID=UPI0002EB46B1|nr:tyrosine-type recombinase/integrase [Vibrio genomosp. F10]OEF06548.1 hypothetical protein A1QK_08075 [Vibrio genomosp. F10 str. 9ZD137]
MYTLSSYIEKIKPSIKSESAHSSWVSERSRFNVIQRDIGHWKLNEITLSEVELWVNSKTSSKKTNAAPQPWSPKTRNNYFSTLSKIMDYAIKEELIRESKLKNLSRSKPDCEAPQPFTQKEILLISNHEPTSHQARLIFVLAVTTGLKISELIALGWEDINFHTKTLFVRRVKNKASGNYEVPKSDAVQRKVELNDMAIAALRAVQKYTGERRQKRVKVMQRDNHTTKKVGVKFVFYNARSDKPFTDPTQYAKMFFTPQLKALGIRHRGAKHTRHTFVVEAIKKGMTKDYIRVQLGCRRDDLFNLHSKKNEEVKCTESIDSSADSLPNLNESKDIIDENNEQPEKPKVPFISWLLNLFVSNRNAALKM